MVLLIPLYSLYYAATQFEHRYKGVVLAGSIGAFVAGATLRLLGT